MLAVIDSKSGMKFRICTIFFFASFSANAQKLVTVEDAVSLALQKNYSIILANTNSESFATDLKYSRGAFLPTLNATSARTWNSNDQKQTLANGELRQQDAIKSNNTNASVQLSWVLFDGLRMFTTRQRLEELLKQGDLSVKSQIVNTAAEVISQYYNVVGQKQLLKAINEQLSINEQRLKLAERKLEVGSGAKPEVLQAKVDLNAQRVDVLRQEALIIQLKNQLNALTGMQIATPFEVSDSILVSLEMSKEEVLKDFETVNPELQISKNSIKISSLGLKEFKADRFPVLRLNSSYNYSITDNKTVINPFQPLFSLNNGYNYGFSIALPLLNGFNNSRLIQQAQINYKFQQILYDQQAMQLRVDAENAFTNYDNARKTLLIEEENIGFAKENVFIVFESYRKGVYSFVELRTAQISLADAYQRLIQARFNAKVAETELLRLSGRVN